MEDKNNEIQQLKDKIKTQEVLLFNKSADKSSSNYFIEFITTASILGVVAIVAVYKLVLKGRQDKPQQQIIVNNLYEDPKAIAAVHTAKKSVNVSTNPEISIQAFANENYSDFTIDHEYAEIQAGRPGK